MESELKELLMKDGLVLGPQIGKGSFGTVYRCTDVKTQIAYAVKKVDLRVLRMQPHFVMDRLKRECAVLENLRHPSVIRLFKTIEAKDALLMVMEMVLGMELFDMIIALSGLNESEACAVFIQIASALAYMHKRGVVHRDIKPENILVQGSTDPEEEVVFKDAFKHLRPRVKLIDFGLSKVLGSDKEGGSVAKSLVGTPRYVAPEILEIGEKIRSQTKTIGDKSSAANAQGLSYSEKVDCYSAGVLLHVMVAACFPQFENSQRVVFQDERVSSASDEAKMLISELMNPNPQQRITMAQALQSAWIKKNHPRAALAALELAGEKPDLSPAISPTVIGPGGTTSTGEFPDSPMNDLMKELRNMNTTESMEFDEKEIDPSQNQQKRPMVGMKRQISRKESRSDLDSIKEGEDFLVISNPRPSTANSDGAIQSKRKGSDASVRSESRSSIEVLNLPGGAAKGVWGPFKEAESRENSVDSSNSEEVADDDAEKGVLVANNIVTDEILIPNMNKEQSLVNPDLLLQLQSQIAQCFRKAFDVFKDDDVVSPGIVSSAVASRELLHASETILKKLEHTSLSVLDLLPDMKIAVEEGEFGMAASCFDKIKDWIKTIQSESQDLLKANVKVIATVNNTLQLARRRQRVRHAAASGYRVTDAVAIESAFKPLPDTIEGGPGASGGAIEAAEEGHRASTHALQKQEEEQMRQDSAEFPSDSQTIRNRALLRKERDEGEREMDERINNHADSDKNSNTAMIPASRGNDFMVTSTADEDLEPISKALAMLKEIDRLLQQHASFWSQMEVIVDVLMQRANHVESMVNYTRNPRLRGRFLERVNNYADMWNRITQMCQQFQNKMHKVEGVQMYQFLTEV